MNILADPAVETRDGSKQEPLVEDVATNEGEKEQLEEDNDDEDPEDGEGQEDEDMDGDEDATPGKDYDLEESVDENDENTSRE